MAQPSMCLLVITRTEKLVRTFQIGGRSYSTAADPLSLPEVISACRVRSNSLTIAGVTQKTNKQNVPDKVETRLEWENVAKNLFLAYCIFKIQQGILVWRAEDRENFIHWHSHF